ncbi:MAG: hypothetical protein EP330_28465 [Deltaproteobacteria bacterium]|nr:MAG: hypothetical protein EP330_28465 [Deltaproteobacteria bacterium]
MTRPVDVEALLKDLVGRLYGERRSLSPLLHGHYAFEAGSRRWVVSFQPRSAALEEGGEADVVLTAMDLEVLYRILLDPSTLVESHQRGEIALSDDTYAPVLHRLLEPPYQSDARQLRVLERMTSWVRF